jgi:hypothetical protein
MKLIFFLSILAFASANAEVDWSNVSPVYQLLMQHLHQGRATRAASSGRIVNGETAAAHQFPYMVSQSF